MTTAGTAPAPRGRRPARRRWPWVLLALLVLLPLLAYAAVLAKLWWGQEGLIFKPVPLAAEYRIPAASAPGVQERFIDVPGARLHALHLRQPGARGVVFLLHGNAGNLERWFVNLDFYRALGFDLFMIDYRGFGKSSGRIESEAQLHDDVHAAWLAVAPEYAGRRVVVVGRSLGTGLAARLAADLPPDDRPAALVLVSPYENMVRMTREQYPFVPPALLRYPLRSDDALPRLDGTPVEVTLLHGDADRLIPIAHAEALGRLLPTSRLVRIPGAGHGDLQSFPAYLDALRAAIEGR